jgi:hypothetical protein
MRRELESSCPSRLSNRTAHLLTTHIRAGHGFCCRYAVHKWAVASRTTVGPAGAAYLTVVDAAYFELARSWRNLVTDAANDHPATA